MQSPKDKRWFTEQVRPLLDTLYRVAYSLLQSDADAQDAAQACVEQAYRSLGTLQDRGKFRPWLLRILKNECYRMLREKKRYIPFDDLPDEGAEPFDALDLKTAFLRLSSESRLAVTLYYYEGYKTREIADILKLSENTVKTRLLQGRKLLKTKLEGWQDEDI